MNDFKLRYSYGDKGKRGSKGNPGCPGVIGNYGDCGVKGHPGIKGLKGSIGIIGPVGYSGDEGAIGIKGIKGEPVPGYTGQKGEKGIHMTDMINLIDSTVIQYNDSTVFEFINGSLKGTYGNKGDSGEIGLPGLKGSLGEIGEKGEKGLTGEKGLSGNSIVTLSHQYLNSEYSINQQFSNQTDTFSINLIGDTGSIGNIGDIGDSITSYISYLNYGFKVIGNSAVVYTASQINDNEFYMFKNDDLFINDKTDSDFTHYYFDLSQSTNYIASAVIFNKFLDKKIIGLYNTSDSEPDTGNILAGSLDTISPVDPAFYNQLDITNRFSRGLGIIAQGIPKYNSNTVVEGISVNLKTILGETVNGFDFINNEYVLTNSTFPSDNSKFYGITKINNFRFYIPIKIFIRLEEHSYSGKKQTTEYRYVNNDIILQDTTDIDQNCASNTLLKYSEWIAVENNTHVSLTSLVWNIFNEDVYDNIKLCVRYKFSLPTNITVGNIQNTTNILINNNTNLSNGIQITEPENIYTDLTLNNSVSDINSYNNLPSIDKNIYLPQVISAIIPINQLSCNIKTSTN